MEEALIDWLLADTALASAFSGRIHWAVRPQGGVLPAMVLTRISGVPAYAHSGPVGLADSRVQADVYARTYAETKAAARALKARLSGAKFTQGGIQFQGAFIDGERDSFEAEERLHRVSVDFILTHSE